MEIQRKIKTIVIYYEDNTVERIVIHKEGKVEREVYY